MRSREKSRKEVPLQRSECEGDLRLVSSLQTLSNAGSGSLSPRVIFIDIILSGEETFLCQFESTVCVCVCVATLLLSASYLVCFQACGLINS